MREETRKDRTVPSAVFDETQQGGASKRQQNMRKIVCYSTLINQASSSQLSTKRTPQAPKQQNTGNIAETVRKQKIGKIRNEPAASGGSGLLTCSVWKMLEKGTCRLDTRSSPKSTTQPVTLTAHTHMPPAVHTTNIESSQTLDAHALTAIPSIGRVTLELEATHRVCLRTHMLRHTKDSISELLHEAKKKSAYGGGRCGSTATGLTESQGSRI